MAVELWRLSQRERVQSYLRAGTTELVISHGNGVSSKDSSSNRQGDSKDLSPKGKLRLGSWRQVILHSNAPSALETLHYKADYLTFIVMAYLDFFQVSNVHRLHCKLIYLPTLKFVLVNL